MVLPTSAYFVALCSQQVSHIGQQLRYTLI